MDTPIFYKFLRDNPHADLLSEFAVTNPLVARSEFFAAVKEELRLDGITGLALKNRVRAIKQRIEQLLAPELLQIVKRPVRKTPLVGNEPKRVYSLDEDTPRPQWFSELASELKTSRPRLLEFEEAEFYYDAGLHDKKKSLIRQFYGPGCHKRATSAGFALEHTINATPLIGEEYVGSTEFSETLEFNRKHEYRANNLPKHECDFWPAHSPRTLAYNMLLVCFTIRHQKLLAQKELEKEKKTESKFNEKRRPTDPALDQFPVTLKYRKSIDFAPDLLRDGFLAPGYTSREYLGPGNKLFIVVVARDLTAEQLATIFEHEKATPFCSIDSPEEMYDEIPKPPVNEIQFW